MGGILGAEPELGAKRIAGISLDEEALLALRKAMAARSWDQVELAARAGCSRSTITNLLRGRKISSEVLLRVARALTSAPPDQSVVALFEGTIE